MKYLFIVLLALGSMVSAISFIGVGTNPVYDFREQYKLDTQDFRADLTNFDQELFIILPPIDEPFDTFNEEFEIKRSV